MVHLDYGDRADMSEASSGASKPRQQWVSPAISCIGGTSFAHRLLFGPVL